MFCTNCGKKMERDDAFCSSCGIAIKSTKLNNASNSTVNPVYEYKTEILKTQVKWINDNASEKDIDELNRLIAKRIAEGWEYIDHSYIKSIFAIKQTFHINFRRIKNI